MIAALQESIDEEEELLDEVVVKILVIFRQNNQNHLGSSERVKLVLDLLSLISTHVIRLLNDSSHDREKRDNSGLVLRLVYRVL